MVGKCISEKDITSVFTKDALFFSLFLRFFKDFFYCDIHHGIKFIRVETHESDKETKDIPSVKLSPFHEFSPLV